MITLRKVTLLLIALTLLGAQAASAAPFASKSHDPTFGMSDGNRTFQGRGMSDGN